MVALIVGRLPEKIFSTKNPLFKSYSFEQGGKFYERYFFIKRWKGYLPDGSAITGVGLKKKHLIDRSPEGLKLYIKESCKAELIHALAIPPFIFFGFFCPLQVVPLMLLYALAVNLPCLITQRYNRPRVERVLSYRK